MWFSIDKKVAWNFYPDSEPWFMLELTEVSHIIAGNFSSDFAAGIHATEDVSRSSRRNIWNINPQTAVY